MGLFDWFRRKVKGKEEKKKRAVRKKPKTEKRGKAKEKDSKAGMADTEMPLSTEGVPEDKQEEVVRLVAEYERLVERREKLQIERGQLTKKLDTGELSPGEFRKALMSKIQEASTVSDKIKRTSSRLTQLGYRGVLH